jgi:hypothetical protein
MSVRTKQIQVTTLFVTLGGLVVACLPLNPWFAGSNPADDDRASLRETKSVAQLPSEK